MGTIEFSIFGETMHKTSQVILQVRQWLKASFHKFTILVSLYRIFRKNKVFDGPEFHPNLYIDDPFSKHDTIKITVSRYHVTITVTPTSVWSI